MVNEKNILGQPEEHQQRQNPLTINNNETAPLSKTVSNTIFGAFLLSAHLPIVYRFICPHQKPKTAHSFSVSYTTTFTSLQVKLMLPPSAFMLCSTATLLACTASVLYNTTTLLPNTATLQANR